MKRQSKKNKKKSVAVKLIQKVAQSKRGLTEVKQEHPELSPYWQKYLAKQEREKGKIGYKTW